MSPGPTVARALRGIATAAVALGAVAFGVPARAELVQGGSFTDNDYKVDLSQGPVLASTRVLGLAGAYVAIAEDTDGTSQNPAAPAVRTPWSFDHFDYDLGVGVTFPTTIANSDFFNTGTRDRTLPAANQKQFLFLDLAANLKFGTWGFGITADLQQYALEQQDPASPDQLFAQFTLIHADLARAFAQGQLILGAGIRATGLDIVNRVAQGSQRTSFSTAGVGPEAGVLWRPNDEQYRIGAALYGAVTTNASPTGDSQLPVGGETLYLPKEVTLPWAVNLGFSLMLGPRPFNPRWYDPSRLLDPVRQEVSAHERQRVARRSEAESRARADGGNVQAALDAVDAELAQERALDALKLERMRRRIDRQLREREARLSRRYVLITTSVLVSGPSTDAVGIESFLSRRVDRFGLSTVVSPRIGVESEVVPQLLKLSAGSYIEPTRSSGNPHRFRTHGTLGTEIDVLPWTVFGLFDDGTRWRVAGSIDLSREYLGWGVSIGVWH